MYQHLTIVGNLGRDPEMRYTPSGTPVTTLSVATNRTYKDNNGQQVKETTWFRVSVFGKMAENCAQYLQKGRMVLVEGRLTPDKQTGGPRIWDKQDGTKAASFEVFATNVRFMPSGQRAEGGPPVADEEIAGAPETVGDEEIPF
jgi:single-strand DNA-binding protein